MKPSEFMKNRKFISHEIYIKDLDKRFIDREKLKEKINKLFNPKISNGEHSIQITKKEILELLTEE